MDEENRLKITLWLKPNVVRRIGDWLEGDNCKSRGEFVEKALRFYMGCLATEDTSEYPSRALVDALRGTSVDNENRLCISLFKLCVEMNMTGHTVVAHFHADPVDRRKLRAFAVDEALHTNERISFDDALDLQRQVYPDG